MRIVRIAPTLKVTCERCGKRPGRFVVSRRWERHVVCAKCMRTRGEALRARIVAA